MLNPELTNLCISKNKEESANMTQFMCIWFSFWMFVPPHDNEKHTWHIMMCMCIKFFLLMSPPLLHTGGDKSVFASIQDNVTSCRAGGSTERFHFESSRPQNGTVQGLLKNLLQVSPWGYYPMAKLNYDIDYKAFGRLSLNRHSRFSCRV